VGRQGDVEGWTLSTAVIGLLMESATQPITPKHPEREAEEAHEGLLARNGPRRGGQRD